MMWSNSKLREENRQLKIENHVLKNRITYELETDLELAHYRLENVLDVLTAEPQTAKGYGVVDRKALREAIR